MGRQELALLIPIIVVSFTGLVVLSRTTIGRALARRIGGEAGAAGGADDGRIEALEQEVQGLRQELTEVHERLDFTERLLVRGRTEEPHAS